MTWVSSSVTAPRLTGLSLATIHSPIANYQYLTDRDYDTPADSAICYGWTSGLLMTIRLQTMNVLSRLKNTRSGKALKPLAAGATLLTLGVGGAAAQPDQTVVAAELFSGDALQMALETADSSTAYFGERAADWLRWSLSETFEWIRWGAEQQN